MADCQSLRNTIYEHLKYISAPPENFLVEGQAREGAHYHIIQQGETVWRIANQYGVSLQQLRQANGLGHTNLVKTGQKLVIP
ncbi:MAG: LysM peptidoglycan-binding domain-containing protein [Candidatus Schekmanbacteria bacterium]|nr:LysM peptidoglycan-binding domain-containing protein [Candidatus Schekmanbacteria bacterium]